MRHSVSAYRLARTVLLAGACLLPLAACGGGDTEARQKEAEAIAKGVEDYLATMQEPGQQAGLVHDKVTVTPSDKDKSYAVAITGLKFVPVAGGSEGITLGEIDYRLTPGDGQTYQVSELKLPQQLSIAGADGKPVTTVSFETAGFDAVWSSPLQNFLKLDWQAKNLAISDATQPDAGAKAESLTVAVNGKDNGKGRLDQTTDMTVSGIAVTDPVQGMNVTIAKLTGDLGIQGFDFPAYKQQMLRLRDITAKFAPKPEAQSQGVAAPAPELTDDDRKALGEIVAALPKTMSAYNYTFGAEGIAATAKDNTVPFKLAQGGMNFALKGLDTEKAELDLGLRHDGLELAGPEFEDPMVKAVLPKSGNLDLVATDIPVAVLVDGLAKQIPQLTSADPAVAKGAQFALMGALMSALSQSQIKLKVEPSHLTTEKASLAADGALQLAMSSPSMAVGTLNLALTGLDDLVALASGLAEQSPDAAQAMGMLQMMQGLAKRETGGDGKPVDKFAVDFGPTGAITVNGKPLDGMMQ